MPPDARHEHPAQRTGITRKCEEPRWQSPTFLTNFIPGAHGESEFRDFLAALLRSLEQQLP
jgi:hypothetical protein